MKVVSLNHFYEDQKQCLGTLTVPGIDIFVCKTLELAWNNNANNISRIKSGHKYLCKWTRSNRISKLHLDRWLKKNPGKTAADCPHEEKNIYTYEVFELDGSNVIGRAGIRIHSANYFFELKGCIALGDTHKDLNIDGHLDVVHSGNTVAKFAKIMNYENFILDIAA